MRRAHPNHEARAIPAVLAALADGEWYYPYQLTKYMPRNVWGSPAVNPSWGLIPLLLQGRVERRAGTKPRTYQYRRCCVPLESVGLCFG